MPTSPSIATFARRQVLLAKRLLPRQLSKFATSLGDRLAITGGQVEQVDERAMSARFVISTNGRDRDGDIMEPGGCNLENYAKNPVVFWDHQSELKPIGMAEKDGKLDLQVLPDRIISTCWFHGKNLLSSEIFTLVADNIIRMASIGFLPVEGERLSGKGHRFTSWELTEWSPTALGVNADALRLHLDKGRVKSMGLRRSLEPFAAKASKSAPKRGAKNMDIGTSGNGAVVEQSVDDKRSTLQGLVQARFGSSAWIADLFDDRVVYRIGGLCAPGQATIPEKMFSIAYTEQDGKCVLVDAEPVEVQRVTTYQNTAKGLKIKIAKGTVTKADPDDDDFDDDDELDVNDDTGPAEEAAQEETAADDAADADDVPADEETPVDEETKSEEPPADDETEPDHAQRHGAQALGTLAAINKAYAEQLTSMLAEHDNPNLRTFIEAELASRNELMPKLEELLAADYPGLKMEEVMPSMDAPEPPAEEEALPTEEVTKTKSVKVLTVKRLNKGHKSIVTDAKDFLEEMGQEPKVPKSLQGSCRYHAKNLTDMVERDAEPDEMPEEAVKALRMELRGVRKAVRA